MKCLTPAVRPIPGSYFGHRCYDVGVNSGAPGKVYRYIGDSGVKIDLGAVAYAGSDDWELLTMDNILPSGLNVSGSDAIGVGAMIVRNDVRSDVAATVHKAAVEAAEISGQALETATILAATESVANAAGGSAFGTGTVVAGNGVAVTTVLGKANAYATDSELTATDGDVVFDARNASLIDATLLASTTSGDKAIGVVLAFNSLGFAPQNLLFNVLDAFLGTDIANEQPAEVQAYIKNSKLSLAGDLTLTALSDAQINATVSNAACSAASALFGANGKGMGGILASNKVSSFAKAYLDSPTAAVNVPGAVTITSEDNAGIWANTKLVSSSITTNDGGAAILGRGINNIVPADFRTDEGTVKIEFGDRVRLAEDFVKEDFASTDGEQALTPGAKVRLADDYGVEDFTTNSGRRLVAPGDKVRVADGYDSAKGTEGAVYVYLGAKARLDLGDQDYTDEDLWAEIAGNAGSVYKYLGSSATLDLGVQDYGDAGLWQELAGAPGVVYEYMGTEATLDLGTQNYLDLGFWKPVPATQLLPQGNNLSDSNAMALGGLVVLNDVRSDVQAYLQNVTLTADEVTLTAIENAVIRATADSSATASGGSAYGSGSVIAVNGTIATNVILSEARAYIADSTVTTDTGDLTLDAENVSQIDAKTFASTTSGEKAVGLTMAFNTIGWEAQNLLFNTVDALLGDPLIANAFGNQQPAQVQAYITDSTIHAAGALTLSAWNEAAVNAEVSNEATSAAAALINASGMSIGGVLSNNMVNSAAQAYIKFTGTQGTIGAGGPVTIEAEDTASIDATVTVSVVSSSKNDAGLSIVSHLVTTLAMDYQYTTKSGTHDVEPGEMVRVADGYTGGGQAGKVYQFEGTAAQGKGLNLGTVNYAAGPWRRVLLADALDIVNNLGLNATSSDSFGAGGLVARNDVRSEVAGYLENVKLTSVGDLTLTAIETATIRATDSSTVVSIGGSVFAGGNSVAVNALIATNLVLSEANTYITDSDVTTSGGGDVVLDARNTSTIDAKITGDTESKGVSVGVTLAFNTIGWDPQNILFNLADAVAGSSIGDENPAEVKAYIANSDVRAAGEVTVTSVSDAAIDATIEQASVAIKATLQNSTSVSVGAVIGMNKLSTLVEAYADGADVLRAGQGDIQVSADDVSRTDSVVRASSVSIAASAQNATSVSVGVSIARNEIANDIQAFLRDVADVTATGGSVSVTADEQASIDASSAATSLTLAIGLKGSTAIGGGGASAGNVIGGRSNAFIEDCDVTATGAGSGQGEVTVKATNSAEVEAVVATVAVTGGIGAGTTPAAAIGVSVARNLIGWDHHGAESLTTTWTTDDDPATLVTGQRVRIKSGPLDGDVYEYLGEKLTDGDPNTGGNQPIDLGNQNYQDNSLWKRLGLNSTPLQTLAFLKNASVSAPAALTVEAIADRSIDAVVVAGAAAISGGGSTGVGISGAGVYAENRIHSDTKAYILGDGVDGITAHSVSLRADDASGISAIAGAASLSVALGGNTGVSVSLGLSLAFNEISGDVAAYIQDANPGVKTTGGDITLSAASRSRPLFDFTLGGANPTASELDDAARADQNDPDTGTNEATDDAKADQVILGKLRAVFKAKGEDLAVDDAVATASKYTTEDGRQDLREGDTVKLADDYGHGGQAGRVYRYIGSDRDDVDLGEEDYANTGNWLLLDKLRVSTLVEGRSWAVVAPDGATYILVLDDDGSTVHVSRSTINVISAAASLGAGIGGTTGVAISGAGAVAQNVILTRTNAFIENSKIDSAGDVTLSAAGESMITSTVIAASLAIGGGGNAGVGASIGVAVSQNFIGWTPGDEAAQAQVRAYIRNSSVRAADDVTLTAVTSQTVHSVVLAGSAAVAAGGAAGVGASGSGVHAENKIGIDVAAFIDGDTAIGGGVTEGILADWLTLTALDNATITSLAGAASLAASLGGAAGVSVSVGAAVARNTITNAVSAYVANADQGVKTTVGGVRIEAQDTATIHVLSSAASVAAGFGGTAGVAVSGAGAEATNEILTDVNAYIAGSRVTSAGDMDLDAANTATIKALVVTASFSLTIGGVAGVGASIGASLARSLIGWKRNGTREEDDVQAYIEDSSVTAGGDLTLTARSEATIGSTVLAGSVAVAAGGTGVAGSGSGVSSENKIGFDVRAYIDGDGGSQIAADRITLSARDTSTIDADAGSAALAATFAASGGSLAVGVALAENQIDNRVESYLKDTGGVDVEIGSLIVTADEQAEIDAVAAAASAAAAIAPAGVAISGGAATAKNTLAGTVSGSIQSSSDVSVAGAVQVSATDTATISAEIASISVASGMVGVAVGTSLAESTISGTVSAFIDDATVTAGSGDIRVTADSQPSIDTKTIVSALSLSLGLSGAGAESKNTIQDTTEAYLNSADLTAAGHQVVVSATSTSDVSPLTEGATVGTAAVGVMLSEATIGGHTRAHAGGQTSIAANRLDVSATDDSTVDPSTAVFGVGGVTGTGAKSTTRISRITEAYLAAGGKVSVSGGPVNLLAHSDADATANATSAAVSLAISVAAMNIDVMIDSQTRAYAGANATISAGDDVTIEALAKTDADADVANMAFSAGASVGYLDVTTTVDAAVEASVGGGAAVSSSAGDVTVRAGHNYDPATHEFLAGSGATAATDQFSVAAGASTA